MERISTITDEDRENLKERLAALDKARAPLLVARQPLEEALKAIDEMHDQLAADAGVEIIGNCEGCETLLVVGDLGHQCSDGPTLCAACAPTWGNLAADYADPAVAADAQSQAEDGEHILTRETIQAHIDAGDGDKKHVWVL